MKIKVKIIMVLLSFILTLTYMPLVSFANDTNQNANIFFTYLGSESDMLWSEGYAEYGLSDIPEGSTVEIKAGIMASSNDWKILFTEGKEYTYDNDSRVLTLFGNEVSKTMNYTPLYIDLQAVVSDSSGNYYGEAFKEVNYSETDYHFVANDPLSNCYTRMYNYGYWTWDIEKTGTINVYNSTHTSNSQLDYTISDVEILSQTPASGTGDVVGLEYIESGEYWQVSGKKYGTALVHVELDDSEGTHYERDVTVEIARDMYDIYVHSFNGDPSPEANYLPGETIDLYAIMSHSRQVNKTSINQLYDDCDIQWDILDNNGRLSLIEDHDNPSQVRVEIANGIDEADDTLPQVVAKLYDADGKEQATSLFPVKISQQSLRLYNGTIDPYLELGQSIIVKPEIRRYYLDSSNTIKYEVIPFSKPLTTKNWLDNTQASVLIEETGNENEFRITRNSIGGGECYLILNDEYDQSVEGLYVGSNTNYFEELHHVISFNECEDGKSIYVANNGDLELTLNTDDLRNVNQEGLDIEICCPNNPNLLDQIFTVEGNKVTVSGQMMELWNRSSFKLQVAAYYNHDTSDLVIAESTITVKLDKVHTHTITRVPAKEATCIDPGYEMHYICTECGLRFEENNDEYPIPESEVLIPATGNHTSGEAVQENKVDPTCGEAGSYDEVVKCTVCGEELSRETKTVPALGHDIEHHEAKAATCTEIGWDAYDTCTRCDYTTYEEKQALGHDIEHHEAKAATCTEIGWDAYDACTRCDYTTYEEKQALGHDFTVEIEGSAKAPTCAEAGKESDKKCSRCDKVEAGAVIPATGNHKWNSSYTVDKKATYAAAGSKSIHCSVCNAKKPNSNVAISKLTVKAVSLGKVTAAKKGFTAKWSKGSSINGYELQYALNNKFTKSKKTERVTKQATVSKKIAKLKAKKKYYIRIRAYKTVSGKKYYSKWSKAKAITTK